MRKTISYVKYIFLCVANQPPSVGLYLYSVYQKVRIDLEIVLVVWQTSAFDR